MSGDSLAGSKTIVGYGVNYSLGTLRTTAICCLHDIITVDYSTVLRCDKRLHKAVYLPRINGNQID